MALLEFTLAIPILNRGEFPDEDGDEEVASTTCRLEDAGVDPLGFLLDEVEHGFDHPSRSEHLTVVSHPLPRFDQPLYFDPRDRSSDSSAI